MISVLCDPLISLFIHLLIIHELLYLDLTYVSMNDAYLSSFSGLFIFSSSSSCNTKLIELQSTGLKTWKEVLCLYFSVCD
jgi:hypothetical protein